MFRVKYTIAEVARLLRRSIPSLIRDVEMGRLTMGGSRVVMRRRGASTPDYNFTRGDLVRYVGEAKVNQALGTPGRGVAGREVQVAEEAVTKRCQSCGRLLPAKMFERYAAATDGLSPDCRTCEKRKALSQKVKLKPVKKREKWTGYFRRGE